MRKKMVQYKDLKFKALYFVEGKATFRGCKYRPDGTVFVVKEGSVLEDVDIPRGLGGVLLLQPSKPEALIEKYDLQTIQDVERLVIDFAETHRNMFFYTAKKVVVEEKRRNYVMSCKGYPDRTATIFINKKYEKALISALQNLRNKARLTKGDEEMLSTLWHEFIHLRTVNLYSANLRRRFSRPARKLMETLTEFIARHTYDRFLDMLRPGTMPNYQKEIIEAGMGYQLFIARFRYVLQKFKINEKEVAKEIEDVLIEGVQHNIVKRLTKWLGTKVNLSKNLIELILDDIVNLKTSDQEFQKRVGWYYEAKGHQE